MRLLLLLLALPFPSPVGSDFGFALDRKFEPSGLAVQPGTGNLAVVSDDGRIALLSPRGTLLHLYDFGEADFEGAAFADDPTQLYVVIEGKAQLWAVDMRSGQVRARYPLPIKEGKKKGLEGLTWLPEGTFVLAHQKTGVLHYVRLRAGQAKVVRVVTPLPQRKDMSGLAFSSGKLFAIYDKSDVLVELSAAGAALRTWQLPGRAQEGLAFSDGYIYIADDDGGVMRYRWEKAGPRQRRGRGPVSKGPFGPFARSISRASS